MSKNSRLRHRQKTAYFDFLKETAAKVDPYVRDFIKRHFIMSPELKTLLLKRYRFGKPQLRPAFVRLGYEIIGAENWQIIIPACAAVEAKDTAYYCWDDIIDLEADPALVILGGSFQAMSYNMLIDISTKTSGGIFTKVLAELCQLDKHVAQAAHIDSRLYEADEGDYWRKAEGYNFWEQALRIGGLLAGGSDNEVTLLGQLGKKIGMAYIIANDTWDFGKDLEDFRKGKLTLPITFALESESGEEGKTLRSLFGKQALSEDEIKIVRKIMVRSGAIDYGKGQALALCESAIEVLEQFPQSRSRELLEFATTMTQRNRHFSLLEKYR